MEAELVSHMKSKNTGYLFPSFPWSWAWAWGNFKPNLKEERQLSVWRLRERAFQEVGRASPKALGGGAWCFWGTARRSECPGRSDICYTHYSKAHRREEESGSQRGCDVHNKWQKPELRSSSSEHKPCVFIKMPFCVYFQIALTFSLPVRYSLLNLPDIGNHTFSGCIECRAKFKQTHSKYFWQIVLTRDFSFYFTVIDLAEFIILMGIF